MGLRWVGYASSWIEWLGWGGRALWGGVGGGVGGSAVIALVLGDCWRLWYVAGRLLGNWGGFSVLYTCRSS